MNNDKFKEWLDNSSEDTIIKALLVYRREYHRLLAFIKQQEMRALDTAIMSINERPNTPEEERYEEPFNYNEEEVVLDEEQTLSVEDLHIEELPI